MSSSESDDHKVENWLPVCTEEEPGHLEQYSAEMQDAQCYEDEEDFLDCYADEPLADEAWLAKYNREGEEDTHKMEELKGRLDGTKPSNTWCKCGRCRTELLGTPRECNCRTEIIKCSVVLNDNSVIEEVGRQPSCITEHPGFGPACLNRWCLQIASDSFKTRDGHKYRQRGSRNSFLRGIAYRQFTRLVHGHLSNKRIPLPACAYHAIRSTLRLEDDKFKGYEDEV